MDHYDEDLFENVFFRNLSRNKQYFEYVTSNRWMIAVPRGCTCEGMKFTQADLETHTLTMVDDKPTAFTTANGKELSIKSNIITTGIGFETKKTVAILFEETFFNKNDESYRVLCISQPLEGNSETIEDYVAPMFPMFSVALYSFEDCGELLWGSTGNLKVKVGLTKLLEQCSAGLSGKDNLSLIQLIGTIDTLYHRSIDNVILKDPVLKRSTKVSSDVRQSVCVAAEIYLMHVIYWPLFRHICACIADREAKLNKITRNMAHLQLKHLNVRNEFSSNIPRARKELSNLSRFTSPLGKLNCLRRVINSLVHDDGSKSPGQALHLSTDDLLPILIFLLVKTEMPNWWGQFSFMKHFRFAPSVLDGEFKFYLATLEAALEHVTNEQLTFVSGVEEITGFILDSSLLADSASSEINTFFQLIIDDKLSAIEDILSHPESGEVEMKNFVQRNAVSLCHPLCTCPKCSQPVKLGERQQLKDVHPTVYTRSDCGFSALHVAAMYGRVEITDVLVNNGAIISASEYRGFTALHLAAQHGHQAIIVLLLHHNPGCINLVNKAGNNALHCASLNGHEGCVKALVYINHMHGLLNLNEMNDFGDTALHLAAKWGYENIVGILLENGASPAVRNRKNQLPCQVAHNVRILRKLAESSSVERQLKRLPDGNSVSQNSTVLKFSSPASVSNVGIDSDDSLVRDAISGDDFTVVHKPAVKSETKVDKLLKFVADGDIQMIKFHLGWLELESENAEIANLDVTKIQLCHPLCQCCRCQLYQKLTQPSSSPMGLHVNSADSHGYMPLHVAAFHGHTEIMQLLLQRGADSCARTLKHGSTALHLACQNDCSKAVTLLVDYGAHINEKDQEGNSPLHICCLCGHDSIASHLLQMGANVNSVNNAGDSPLHIAVRAGYTSLAGILMECGADVMTKNMQAMTAWQCAQTTGMKVCLQTLHATSVRKSPAAKPSGSLPRVRSLNDTRNAWTSESNDNKIRFSSSGDMKISIKTATTGVS